MRPLRIILAGEIIP